MQTLVDATIRAGHQRGLDHNTLLQGLHTLGCGPTAVMASELFASLDEAHAITQQNALRITMVDRLLTRAANALQGVDFLHYKGTAFSRITTGDRRARETCDVDLLVHPADMPQACQRLLEDGLAPVTDHTRPWRSNQQVFHDQRGLCVELHWAIHYPHLPGPSTDELLASAYHPQLLACPTIDPAWTWIALAYHFHQHHGYIKGIFDAALWLQTFSNDREVLRQIYERAAALGILDIIRLPAACLAAVCEQTYEPFGRLNSASARLFVQVFARRFYSTLESAARSEAGLDKTWSAKLGRWMATIAGTGLLDHGPDKVRSAALFAFATVPAEMTLRRLDHSGLPLWYDRVFWPSEKSVRR